MSANHPKESEASVAVSEIRERRPSSTFISLGGPDSVISDEQLIQAVKDGLARFGPAKRVLGVVPDETRGDSRASTMARATLEHCGGALDRLLIAAGTHKFEPEKIRAMYSGIPFELFHHHNWRTETATVGVLPGEFVKDVTGGMYNKPWKAQLNRLIAHGGYDLVLSMGQVVPHEVTGMANHAKNLFVGCGGAEGINESHFIGAVYGMEKMMGKADTPVRRILNAGEATFCSELPIVYALSVVGPARSGEKADKKGLVTRGFFMGIGPDCFEAAAKLSVEVNFNRVETVFHRVVVSLPESKFESTWLGNKAVYRTRMAIADGGELIILAPGVQRFGEDDAIDALIRKYGYRTTPEILQATERNDDLKNNLSAAAHLIHGSSEGRFTVRYCPGGLSEDEVREVGYEYGALSEYSGRYPAGELIPNSWNRRNGEDFYYISDPSLGLWAHPSRL